MQPLSFIILAGNTNYLSPERERGGGGGGWKIFNGTTWFSGGSGGGNNPLLQSIKGVV